MAFFTNYDQVPNYRLADHPAVWTMKPKKRGEDSFLIIVLHLEVRIVRMASA